MKSRALSMLQTAFDNISSNGFRYNFSQIQVSVVFLNTIN